jgi:hypothetical protein
VVVRVCWYTWIEIRGELQQQRSEKFYLLRRERKGLIGSCSGTQKLVPPSWSGWKLGFIAFLLPEGRDFGMDESIHKGEVSLWHKHLFIGKEKCLPAANRCFLGRRRGISHPG